MPRKPRIHEQGGFYHVMLRGNAGQIIFFDDKDREQFFNLLQEGAHRYNYLVHAFCLMSNHVHLVVQQGKHPLSKPMQNLSFRYTRWINKNQQRTGHLFQGRYKAILVDKDNYLLQLIRYVHLNPVRAKITTLPEEYKWSSHRAYLGLEVISWLSIKTILTQFSENLNVAQQIYSGFVRQGLSAAYCKEFHEGGTDSRILGSDIFVKKTIHNHNEIYVSKPNYTVNQIMNFICEKFNISHERLQSKNRNRFDATARLTLVWLCYKLGVCTITEISALLNRDPTGFIRSLHKLTDQKVNNLERIYENFLQEVEE